MNDAAYRPRNRRRVCVGVCTLVLLSLAPAPSLHAQPITGAQHRSFADQYLQRGDLGDAIDHYETALKLLPVSAAADRAHCCDRLLALYARTGRFDQAIALGNRYAAQLDTESTQPHRRAVLKQLGACYLALGHYADAQKRFEQAVDNAPADIDPLVAIEAHAYLAQIAEKLRRPTDAADHWDEVRTRARIALIKPPASFTAKEIAVCTWKLAASLADPKEAIERLEALAAEQDSRKDYRALCATLQLLSARRVALADRAADGGTQFIAAEHDVRQAIAVYDKIVDPDPARQGDLRQELARLLEQRGEQRDAADWREKAARLYAEAAGKDHSKHLDHEPPHVAFWKLQQLYQQARLYEKALKFGNDELHGNGARKTALEQSRLRAEQGLIQVYLGALGTARKSLELARDQLSKQQVVNLIDLPRVLTGLAVIELHNAPASEQAAEIAGQVRKLYATNSLPLDLVMVETANILGACKAMRGDYRRAIADFREGVMQCETLGSAADRQRCNLLLNIAILHRSQNELTEARKACEEAINAYRRFAGAKPDKQLGFGCFLGALANMDAALCGSPAANDALARFDVVGTEGKQLAELCTEHRIKEGPLLRTALHCQALARLAHKDFAAAQKFWQELADMQNNAVIALPNDPRRDPLLPQTLNWLGQTAELQGQADAAEKLYAEALRLQSGTRSHPTTRHTTLRHLAALLDRRGEHAESRKLLEQAAAIGEHTRGHTWSGPHERAAERLVEECVRDGRLVDALVYSARSHSRSLFDQLQRAGVDHGVEELRTTEETLRATVSRIRLGAKLLTPDADTAEVDRLLAELDAAQKRHADVEREIYTRSKVYGALAVDAKLPDILRQHVVRPGRVVIGYHIGDARSYLMLLSDRSANPEVWPLTVPARLLDAVQGAQRSAVPVTGANGAPAWLLNRRLLRQLVTHHLRQIEDADFTARGLKLSWDSTVATPGEVLEQIAETVLPRAARARLEQLGARQLVVVPDGALHRLPLESLVLRAGTAPRYVLDELPPIIYAPSLSILAHLAQHRAARAATDMPSLLTVCNPAYQQRAAKPGPKLHRLDSQRLLRGDLPLLPLTVEESKRVRGHFDPAKTLVLEGAAATVANLRNHVKDRQIVHLAVHGMAGRPPNTTAELFLTPDRTGNMDVDDGVLALSGICRLPLEACDLAVLSACETGVGPQEPLEAGATLGNAFLMAGARRVIASHWHVEDQSTAELVGRYFDDAMQPGGKRASYAQALQNARKQLRGTVQWGAPVHWAPFVLIGTGDVLDSEPPVVEHSERVAEPASPEPEWYASPWFVPGVAIAVGVVLLVLVRLLAATWRRRDEYRMPGTY